MNWLEIKISADNTHFLFEGKPIFNIQFREVLKFHAPGIAPVKDESGSYHIDSSGRPLYTERYSRTFGYYCNRAVAVQNEKWFHLNEQGKKAHSNSFAWSGNYQENLCPVRDADNNYFHINLEGEKIYSATFIYAGDYKYGIACVKTESGFYRHIDACGNFIYNKNFLDLGIFHKNFATARDERGWHHIDKIGNALYGERFMSIEPFYNGFALVNRFDNRKAIINENGQIILNI